MPLIKISNIDKFSSEKNLGMLGIEPGAAGSRRKYANHCAKLLCINHNPLIVILLSSCCWSILISEAKNLSTGWKDRNIAFEHFPKWFRPCLTDIAENRTRFQILDELFDPRPGAIASVWQVLRYLQSGFYNEQLSFLFRCQLTSWCQLVDK